MKYVTLPRTLQEIGYAAMDGCHKLKDIEFSGTVEEWDAIHKAYGALPEQFPLERSLAEQARLGETVVRPANSFIREKRNIHFVAQEAPVQEMAQSKESTAAEMTTVETVEEEWELDR